MTRKKPNYGVLFDKFGDGRTRPPLRRGRRGQIDPACMLPPLARLLAIDAAEEQAVAGPGVGQDERTAAGSTSDTSSGTGPQINAEAGPSWAGVGLQSPGTPTLSPTRHANSVVVALEKKNAGTETRPAA